MHRISWLLGLSVIVMALWVSAGETVSAAGDGEGAAAEPTSDSALEWPQYPPADPVWQGPFATHPVCAECHTNTDESVAMRDIQGRPVAPYDLWRSSMMANAFRDPYWQAAVSAEVLDLPELSEAIDGGTGGTGGIAGRPVGPDHLLPLAVRRNLFIARSGPTIIGPARLYYAEEVIAYADRYFP